MHLPLKQRWLHGNFVAELASPIRFTLGRVMVCIRIGHWDKTFLQKIGSDMPLASKSFVLQTVYTLMSCELVIWRRYYVHPEPTTEKA